MSRGNSFSSKQMDSLEDSVLVSIIVHLGQSIFGKTNFDTKLWTSAPPRAKVIVPKPTRPEPRLPGSI